MFIHTVYKPEENINYIEEWLEYHTRLGITHFYMYDNSGGIEERLVINYNIDPEYLKHTNKHGVRFEVIADIHSKQREIFKRYPVTWVKWQKRNKNNLIVQDLNGAINHFARHIKSGLCAFIDIDEFIIKNEEFKPSRLQQHKYKSRFFYKSVYDCHERVPLHLTKNWNPKAIIDMSNFPENFGDIHFRSPDLYLPETTNFFNHYNHNKVSHTAFDGLEMECLFHTEPYETIFEYVEDTGLSQKNDRIN